MKIVGGDDGLIKARHDWEEAKKFELDRYKTCGHSHPLYNQEGEFDEVSCDLEKEFLCGDGVCPLDKQDTPPTMEER